MDNSNISIDMKKFSLVKHDPRILELISETNHKILAIWAIDFFNRGRYLFNKDYPENEIIDKALDTLKLWINDSITMWEARKYCWVVLKSAREIEPKDKVACQILRACSHTLATCHVPTHSEKASMYIISAIQHYYKNNENVIELMEKEREWHISHLLELKKQRQILDK